jgi:hypothetical protein
MWRIGASARPLGNLPHTSATTTPQVPGGVARDDVVEVAARAPGPVVGLGL